MTYIIVPRTAIGLSAKVYNSDGATLRPLLQPNRPMVVVHYTGPGVWANKDTAQVIRSIQAWAQSVGKPNEYNWVVDQAGRIFEYAGKYRAAHCTNYNDLSHGVLFLNGVTEPTNPRQIIAFRWLRDMWLKPQGMVAPDVKTVPHRDLALTTTHTPCPGALILSEWDAITREYAPEAKDPTLPAHTIDLAQPFLQQGMRSTEVSKLQGMIKIFFPPIDPGPIDGIFGNVTLAAVIQLQQELNRRGYPTGAPDGIYNWAEYNALVKEFAKIGWLGV
jgi:peptidoglycan hydrolase-like protein with peptidoglycan-binding domain